MDKTVKRNRGRPKSLLTLERGRMKEIFAQVAPYLPSEESDLMRSLKASLSPVDDIEKQILRDYKYDASVPNSHAYAMASVGDEAMDGYDRIIMDQDEAHLRRVTRQRQSGAEIKKQDAIYRADRVLEKNKLMIDEFLKVRGATISAVASKIRAEWDHVAVNQRTKGETITSRGDGGPAPSNRTIRNWITSRRNTPTSNLGKSSF